MSSIYQLQQLKFYYAKQLALSLDNVSIAAGKTTALIGSNGSGKSTLLNLLAFLEVSTQGTLLFQGKPVHKKQLKDEQTIKSKCHTKEQLVV